MSCTSCRARQNAGVSFFRPVAIMWLLFSCLFDRDICRLEELLRRLASSLETSASDWRSPDMCQDGFPAAVCLPSFLLLLCLSVSSLSVCLCLCPAPCLSVSVSVSLSVCLSPGHLRLPYLSTPLTTAPPHTGETIPKLECCVSLGAFKTERNATPVSTLVPAALYYNFIKPLH